MVIDCALVYVPAGGENVGVAATVEMVNVAFVSALEVNPVRAVMAITWSDPLTVIGPAYTVELVVGKVLLVV